MDTTNTIQMPDGSQYIKGDHIGTFPYFTITEERYHVLMCHEEHTGGNVCPTDMIWHEVGGTIKISKD